MPAVNGAPKMTIINSSTGSASRKCTMLDRTMEMGSSSRGK